MELSVALKATGTLLTLTDADDAEVVPVPCGQRRSADECSERASSLSMSLKLDGFVVVEDAADDFARAAAHAAVLETRRRGLPACFSLMSPSVWRVLRTARDRLAVPALGADARLERSAFCWHVAHASERAVDGAFSTPHRDYPVDDGGGGDEDEDDDEKLGVVSCWIPLTPHGAPADGGCLHFVPRLANEWEHPPPPAKRLDNVWTACSFDLGTAVAAPVPPCGAHPESVRNRGPGRAGNSTRAFARAGAALWAGTTIHWGGTPMRGRPDRVTLACAFRNRAVDERTEPQLTPTLATAAWDTDDTSPVWRLRQCLHAILLYTGWFSATLEDWSLLPPEIWRALALACALVGKIDWIGWLDESDENK